MTWKEFEIRRNSLLTEKLVGGQKVQGVRADILNEVFERFTEKVSKDSNPLEDTAQARENSLKLRKRFGIDFEISENDLLRLINTENIDFKMGHGWVIEQLENRLISHLTTYLVSVLKAEALFDSKDATFKLSGLQRCVDQALRETAIQLSIKGLAYINSIKASAPISGELCSQALTIAGEN